MTQSNEYRRITTLPQAVADRIAAGEVVDRPASVIKELIENALDADARSVTIIIEAAGRTLLKVVDDGAGMSADDLTVSIGRHATSKLNRFEDLQSLDTFGFRGEALPSIAAVSRMEIISRVAGEEFGTILKVAGGQIERCEPVAAPRGTSVSVGHLFYNVPARRKFLRTDNTEFKWIARTFRNFALAFPEIGWELFKGKESLYKLAAGDQRSRLAGLFGDDVAEEMIAIDHTRGWMRVRGWISPPSLTQRTTGDQYLFINKRPIVNPRLNRAVYTACEPYFLSGGHPLYVVQMEAEPDSFDINVHPAKKEVKFADESGAFSAVWSAVRNAIAASRTPADLPVTEPSAQTTSSRPAVTAERANVPSPAHLTPYVPIPRQHGALHQPVMPFPKDETAGVETARFDKTYPVDERVDPSSTIAGPAAQSAEGPTIWQIFDTYIISPLTTGLVFIDQHIAHERVLYERALAAMEKEPWSSQQLLFPVTFSMRAEDVGIVEECLPWLRAMGFEVDPVGPREFRISSAPAGIRISNEREMLTGMLEEFKETASAQEDPRIRLAAAFACRGAVKAGQPLESEEMQRLIDELFRCEDPEFCPHGRPIYHVLNRREIDKWFKR